MFDKAKSYWKPPFRYVAEGTMIVDADEARIIDVRGWGHLTGQGAWRLPDEKAEEIQDQIGRHLALMLNVAWSNAAGEARASENSQHEKAC